MASAKKRNQNKPYHRVMLVTPEKAQRWLDSKNTANRNMRKGWIRLLVREILAGEWEPLPHQGIAFDINGILIDGQNRLQAIVDSNTPVYLYVWFNVSIRARSKTDRGNQRSLVDVARLDVDRGLGKVTHTQIAVLRAMCSGARNGGRTNMTDSEELNGFALHMPAIDFALQHMRRPENGMKGIATAIERGVVARAYYSADRDKLATFCDNLIHGMRHAGNGVIGRLWDVLLAAAYKDSRKRVNREIRYGLVERALHAYLKGARLQQLCPATGELFPLPDESAANNLRLLAAQ